ncbi:MAG: DUF421 domain-containing protein [Oscillospiraceae bacterium]
MDILKIIITSAVSLLILFLLTKLMGSKQVSQLNMFDYIVGISIGSIAAEMATELDTPINAMTAMIVYGVIAAAVSLITQKSLKMRKILSGKPLVLLDNGKLYRKNFKKTRMDINDFLMQCRSQGYFDISQIQTAVMEFNGRMSILPISANRPLTPQDMNLAPEQEYMTTAIIADGVIIEDNLKHTGNNYIWLKKQLSEQGYNKPEDVFLAMCDNNNKLTIYGTED